MSITNRLKPTLDDWFTKCDPFYGVCIDEYSGRVEIVCVGVNCVDKKLFDVYDSVDELPKWLQDKIVIEYDRQPEVGRTKLFNYFVKHKLKNLMEHINEF